MTSVVRYVITGLTANGLGLGLFHLMTRQGVEPELASFLAFFPAFLCAYLMNRAWSFGSDRGHASALTRYFLATCAALALQIGLVSVLFRVFGLWPLAAQILALGVATPVSYLLLKHWVFGRTSGADA